MAKHLRKFLISVIGAISLLLMGFFFVGCDEDFSDITLSSDKAYVEVFADGDSQSIVFTLDNYRNGYNNTIMLSYDGPANFEYSQNRISDNQIRVDVTGKFGGSSKLVATTFESAKKCEVEIFVKKYSQTMSENKDTVLYLSNTTDFVPTTDNFVFDSDTTEKAVTYFYLDAERQIDNEYTLTKQNADFANNKVRLTNQAFGVDATITKFDKIVLKKTEEGNVPYLYLNGQEVKSIAMQNKFFILCVYDYSIGDEYLDVAPNFLYTISSVNVLPSIDVKLSGGYEIGGNVEFGDIDDSIVIVPNNEYKANYVIKVEVSGTDVKMEKSNSDNISFNDYNYHNDDTPNVKYYKLSREFMKQVQANISLHIYYELAKNIEDDESVNYIKNFDVEVKIAPKELLVNGTTTPTPYILYNYYDETTASSSDYGWKELNLSVSSGISAVPNFDYFYFEFGDEIKIENSKGETVKSGAFLYDLSEPFFVRGTTKSNFTGASQIKIFLVSDVLESETDDKISISVDCDIQSGATEILGGSNTEILYLDYYGGKNIPFGKLYADHPFESISVVYESGTGNVVNFETGSYINDGASTDYYLDIKVTPRAVGQGRYTVYLDNGVYTQVIFEVVKTLNEETTSMQLAGTGNNAVKYHKFYADEGSDFENNLDLEILNASDSNSVTFGSRAVVNIISNAQSISEPEYEQNYVSVVNSGASQINIITTGNGDESILITLVGYSVDHTTFKRSDDKTLTLKINVSSYSLINDFSLTNSRGDARNNTIYYGEGNIQPSDMQAEFEIVANNINSKNFYHYFFIEEELAKMYEDATKVIGQTYYSYTVASNQYELRMSKDKYYDDTLYRYNGYRFVDFYASIKNSKGYAITTDTLTTVTITKFEGGNSTSKQIVLTLPSGIMFYSENMNFSVKNGNVVTNYTVAFTNEFQVGTGNYGVFNLDNLTYVNKDIASYDLVLETNLRQRDSSKQYTVSISATKYQSVENIYMLESITNIDFTNKEGQRSKTFSVITYPNSATNNSITVSIQNTSGYDFFEVIYKDKNGNFLKDGSGNFAITISCEKFLLECKEKDIDVSKILAELKATVYIFPLDWGEVYTDPNVFDNSPIAIDVQYRNGSRANPYLIENVSDLIDINSSDEALRSHYEIKANIDMSAIDFDNFVPIGILQNNEDYELVGFSGTIVGTTAQAKISNVNLKNGVVLSENVGSSVVQSYYSGLFARLNPYYDKDDNLIATIENLTVSGSMNINLTLPNLGETTAVTPNSYIGLLSGENLALVQNVKAEVSKSTLNVNNPSNSSYNVYVGGLVGANYGSILQDFTQYETKTNPENYEHDFAGQSVKNMVYFNDFLTINSSDLIFAGGVAGASSGVIERIGSDKLKYYGYSAYSAYTLIRVESAYRAFVGGASGVISNYAESGSYITNRFTLTDDVALKNLLVGGEIDTTNLDNTGIENPVDYVGGIVGYVDSVKVKAIEILANETRVFLRACANVGAIVGYDVYNSSYGEEVYTIFENPTITNSYNTISAIDDGRTAFYSSMIIKTRINSNLPATVTNSFFAIGGYNGLDYSSYHFEAYSYLTRGTPLSGPIVSVTSQSKTSYYGDYIIVYKEDSDLKLQQAYTFEKGNIVMEYDRDKNPYMMSSDQTSDVDVFFMYYFGVSGRLGSESASVQDEVNDLNTITVGSRYYPFAFSDSSNDIKITSTNTDVLTVDSNGNLTVLNSGRVAILNLSSILNVNVTKTIYVYVINYFNKDAVSMFYTGASLNTNPIVSGSNVNIYGYTETTINLVPSYDLTEGKDVNGTEFKISKTGVLSYKNVSYQMKKNANVTVKDLTDSTSEDFFSQIYIDVQTVMFLRKDGDFVNEERDNYKIVPVLITPITDENGNKYTFYYVLEDSSINLKLTYRDRATKITSQKMGGYVVKTNEEFADTVTVTSSNDEDLLFYTITNKFGQIIQSRFPSRADLNSIISDTEYNALSEDLKVNYQSWSYYINSILDNRDTLFNLKFTRDGNKFNFTGMVNSNSDIFKDRFKNDIFGDYVIDFYASELNANGAPTLSYVITLEESELSSFEIRNFSNKNDVTEADQVVIPSREGLLEIDLDPIEAVFDTFTISNDAINNNPGGGIASFQFAYRKYNASSSIEYVKVPNFGSYIDGTYTFTYANMIEKLKEVIGEDEDFYVGKIFIVYTLPSINVEDGISIKYNVSIKKLSGEEVNRSVLLTTKLESYAKLVFDAKQEQNGYYYLARGLSYQLHLESYGFDFATDTLDISTNAENVLTFNPETYILDVTDDVIIYPSDKPGFYVEVTTIAKKVVDNVNIITNHVLKIYVMEYVLNYMYVDGVNEDIVYGMENGSVDIAIGNPFEFKSSIDEFIEYDSSNTDVADEVSRFVNALTSSITWTLFDNNEYPTGTNLEQDRKISTEYYVIDSFTFTALKEYNSSENIYYFVCEGHYNINGGIYNATSTGSDKVKTQFVFNIRQQSTRNSPIPIRTYEDFIAMEDDGWYILLEDIDLPDSVYVQANEGAEQFTPITANIAGLDGNGHYINFSGNYNFESAEIGIFTEIADKAIINNVNIRLVTDTTFEVLNNASSSAFNIGLLAATNNGIVTNCQVESMNGASLIVENATSNYISGLIANNNGYITHSRSMVNIKGDANISGLIGTNSNSGIVTSSYYYGASILNSTAVRNTAGFVVVNDGKIYTSYVSGKVDASKMYYDGSDNRISSGYQISGFAYSNTGEIEDCYTNINLEHRGFFASGFVYENSGNIERCFSTSVLASNQASSFGFARSNNIVSSEETTHGTIKNCYYLSDNSMNINVSIEKIPQNEYTDIKDINIDQFKDIDNYFSDYVVSNGRDINSVWFYNEDANNNSNFNESKFNTGRIELVAPNIIAHSQRNLIGVSEVVSDEGAVSVVYSYAYVGNSYGSVYNPILINNAENFETYISSQNSQVTGLNEKYYRLISDIDYSEYSDISRLYKTRFMGYIEGNFMSIKGITLSSGDSLIYGGMFSEIGGANNNSIGTVMNLSISPKVVSFSNSRVVGTLAGKVDGGTLVNINILTDSTYLNSEVDEEQNISVSGLNIVGGVVGLALGDYKFQNVYSSLDAVARNQSISLNEFNSSSNDYTSYSFAGSVFGVLSGNGQTINTVKDTTVTVLGAKAGLLFGLIDNNAKVDGVSLKMFNENIVNAYNYGGLVAGECKGIVNDVNIIGTGEYFKNFSNVPYTANAIGGFAGLVSGGSISNLKMSQSIAISTISTSKSFESLGGVAGSISASTILSDITVKADLIGFTFVGGVAGKIDSTKNLTMTLTDIDVLANLQIGGLYEGEAEIGAGGLTGKIGNNTAVYMSASDEKRNMFEITTVGSDIVPSYGVYAGVYSNLVKVNIGAIVGLDDGAAYTLSKVDSSITGTVNIIDRGIVSQAMTISLKSGDNALIDELAADLIKSKYITESISPATDSNCYCDIAFTRPNKVSNDYILYAKFFGTATGTAITFEHNNI